MRSEYLPDSPDYYVGPTGTFSRRIFTCATTLSASAVLLSTIVAALFERAGLTADEYDVSDLSGITVTGYRVLPSGSGIDTAIAPLMQAYFFDVAEWDGKLRCVLRGAASVIDLTTDDLAERDGEALEWTRVQEAELLRKVTVGYMDPAAGYGATTQKWERRAGTVQAKGEAAVEIPITADADTAAQISEKRGKVAWAETEKLKFSLPCKFSRITPTDVATVTDAASESHRIRVMQVEEDSGVLMIEGVRERQSAYTGTASGVRPETPIVPDGGALAGPTILHAMNLPSLRSSDTVPGFYAGVTGLLTGWKGADLYVSADNGASYQFAKRILSRATLGELASAVTSSGEPISVTLYDNRTLSSITADQLAARQNAFAIVSSGTAEIGQFQTATANGDDYDLTDTLRGLDTTAAAHSAGDEWTLLDGTVAFVPLDIAYAGADLLLKAVSIGTSLDDTDAVEFTFDPPTYIIDGGGD